MAGDSIKPFSVGPSCQILVVNGASASITTQMQQENEKCRKAAHGVPACPALRKVLNEDARLRLRRRWRGGRAVQLATYCANTVPEWCVFEGRHLLCQTKRLGRGDIINLGVSTAWLVCSACESLPAGTR